MASAPSLPPTRRLRLLSFDVPRMRRDLATFFSGLEADLGDVACIRIGPIRFCLLTNPDLIREFLIAPPGQFQRSGFYQLAKAVMGEGLLTAQDGPAHRQQRRLAQPAFTPARIATYAGTMVECAHRRSSAWRDAELLDLYDEMCQLSLDVAARTLFGTDAAADVEIIRESINTLLTTTNSRWAEYLMGLVILLHKVGVPTVGSPSAHRAIRRLNEFTYRIIRQRREGTAAGEDLLSFLMRARDTEGDGSGMTDQQLRDQVMTFLLAGHETIATTLTWAWYALARNPQVESRLHAEVDAVLGDRAPTAADLPQLDYTRRVFQETLRMYPAIWIMGRTALHDRELGAYRVPRGTQLVVSPYVVHRCARFFPRPEQFDPDRWLDPDMGGPQSTYTFIPFGGGARRCIGEPFARVEGPLLLATLAQRWRFVLQPGQENVGYAGGIVLRPKGGLQVRAERRQPAPIATVSAAGIAQLEETAT